MGALLTLILYLFLFIFLICSVLSLFAFLVDVIKWHPIEKKIIVKCSNESEVNSDERDNNGSSDRSSDGSTNGINSRSCDRGSDRDSGSSSDTGTESGERDSRSIFDSWLQP